MTVKKTGSGLLAGIAACLMAAGVACADQTVTVDPAALTSGYMNVSELDGTYLWGSTWGIPDLTAVFDGGVLTLGPNTINDPAEYWYVGGGGPGASGNKLMEANLYNETTGTYADQTLTFTGEVLANTLTQAHTSIAFIKEFAPDYSSFNGVSVPLAPGVFTIELPISSDAARHVQYGFTTTGVNVWATDVEPYGMVEIAVIPEPATLVLLGLGTCLLALRPRRRRAG